MHMPMPMPMAMPPAGGFSGGGGMPSQSVHWQLQRRNETQHASLALAAVRVTLEALLLRVPHLTVLLTSRTALGSLRHLNSVAQFVRPLATEDAAGLLALSLGSSLRASGLTFERACELVSAVGCNPARILQMAADMRAMGII